MSQQIYTCNRCGRKSEYAWGWVEGVKISGKVKHYCQECTRNLVKLAVELTESEPKPDAADKEKGNDR